MKLDDLILISSIVYRRAGIVLGREKDYLIDTRLAPIARQFGHLSIEKLVEGIRRGNAEAEEAAVEAMTTNETLFFRDKQPFEHFSDLVIPNLLRRRAPGATIRIWCAACSSGQEPYSVAMLADELGPRLGASRIAIVATDLSKAMIARARAGIYSQFEIQRGLPNRFQQKHFVQDGVTWRIDHRLTERIEFRTFNLLDDFSMLGRFDIIFCRNLLIYFDEARKRDILNRLARSVAADGYVFLGAAETVIGLTQDLIPHMTAKALYVPKTSDEAQQLHRITPVFSMAR